MNLWFSSHFLFAGLFLGVSALTDEECRPLVQPLSLANLSTLHDKVHLLMGYADNDVFNAIMRLTESYWMEMSPASGDNQLVLQQEHKINGTCFGSKVNVTIDGDTATLSFGNITITYELLPTCDGCLVLKGKSVARNLNALRQAFKISSSTEEEEVTVNALYLMAKQTTLTDSELEAFKQQARCLNFSGEPIFQHDPTKEFCEEGESIQIAAP